MTCCYCRTTFYYASAGGPAEDCDCGRNATKRDVADDKAERVDATAQDAREATADTEGMR